MSAPICPDCGNFSINERVLASTKIQHHCTLCGWKGKQLPRKRVHIDRLREMEQRKQRMLKQKKEGKLFFLRIYFEEQEEDDVTDQLMELLDLDSLEGGKDIPEYAALNDFDDKTYLYFFIEVHKKPSEEMIKKIKGLKGVFGIDIS